jgi:polar amino acid transport system ATP-binding protein
MTDAAPMVAVERLSKRFGPLEVLKDVSLSVAAGEVIVMIGSSGSGKTTLLRCINMLEVPERGRIFVDGEPMGIHGADGSFAQFPERLLNAKRAGIGMVFQRFNLFPHLTALQNVTLGPLMAKKLPPREARELGIAQLEKVGLGDKIDTHPPKLSGGQQQRVAIARALAMAPKLILFDEPTSSLDPELVGEVLETMRQLADDGMTMIIVTHEMDFAYEAADRILFLHEGAILEQGPPATILTDPQHERTRAFLRRTLRHRGERQAAATNNLRG